MAVSDVDPMERLVTVEPALRRALVGAYGVEAGREAASEALLWACQHQSELDRIDNLGGYLYRVGQTAAQRLRPRSVPLPHERRWPGRDSPDFEPGLVEALARLSGRQRQVVLLVKAFEYTPTEVAELLECSLSSVRVHLARALDQLRAALKVTIDD